MLGITMAWKGLDTPDQKGIKLNLKYPFQLNHNQCFMSLSITSLPIKKTVAIVYQSDLVTSQ